MSIMATGGGAYKYYEEMKRVLSVEVLREDEMDCLIMGMYDTKQSRSWLIFDPSFRP